MRYQSIQALRALAALMVIILHSNMAVIAERRSELVWLPGFSDFGWMGVDLFFVISGFIIAHVLSDTKMTIGTYFWRRFWRIYPLYWLVMLVGLYYYRDRGWWGHSVEELGTMGMVKSFLIFPLEPHPFWNPGWSLEHEILFYIIAALVVPLAGLRALASVMFGLGAIGLLFPVGWDFHVFDGAQVEFGAGVLAYLLRNRSWKEAAPVALIALSAVYGHHYGLLPVTAKQSLIATAIGAAALIVTLLDVERNGWKVPRALVVIGNASFSLYLWHWLFLPFFGRWTAEGGSMELWRWKFVALSIVTAVASYYLLERLLIKFSHIKWRRPA